MQNLKGKLQKKLERTSLFPWVNPEKIAKDKAGGSALRFGTLANLKVVVVGRPEVVLPSGEGMGGGREGGAPRPGLGLACSHLSSAITRLQRFVCPWVLF